MNNFKNTINKDISKGGLIGALIGAVASTQIHKKDDSTPKKALKTGIMTSIGFFLGALVEKLIGQRKH
jgi:uncharacterized protein YqgC (DUF456 family)